ncbi:Ubiquinone biosynthesis O-methyltransferase [Psilocybe cubensis]|uniref:Ubiquinone biosynthesis O-methyltransferase, mitochondrial n=2 Tax=Psilocybe cubensis TaxID=181762 RepID=A0A8H7XVP6_PSICU|nr:Ubiquinone biosynthesis O-methyltransferase [Psilocybe cubensis]KAH9479352.1 Ubiquinone biosynthesis O-methyltransferase [Psilocybe cubensis]
MTSILRRTRNASKWTSSLRFNHHSQGVRTIHSASASTTGTNSVNTDEIAHFSKLSSEWWDEKGEFNFLHKMNPVRIQFIREKMLEVAQAENPDLDSGDMLTGLDVLDVGCGGGLLSESLARLGAKTTGIDASESNIAIASLHAAADPKLSPEGTTPNLSYLHTSAENLLPNPKRYDVVCSMEVLEHVDNPATFLATCAELLKPGGHLFLSTISRTPLAYALTIFMAEDVLRQVSQGTHTYSKYIKPSELVQFFRDYPQQDKSNPLSGSSSSRPWISTPSGSNYLPRMEAELRGLIYNPFQARWHLAPKDAWGALECNYIFWVRKPMES